MNFDDYGLDDEVKAKIAADYEADIKGLKSKNYELIEREKSLKADVEKVQLDAAAKEEDAKVALAEKDGDIEKYKVAVAEREERMKQVEQDFIEKDKARVLDMAANDFVSSNVADDPAAKKYMESVFRDGVDVVDGKLKPKDVTKTIEDLTMSIVQDNAYANYIKVDVGSGANSVGSTSTTGKAKSLSEMTATEEAIFANSNPELYAQMTKQ